MARFDLASYVTVAQRIELLYELYPEASIKSFIQNTDGKSVMVEARIFKSRQDALDGIYTSGLAHEREGSTPVTTTSFLETCETSAVGRALANCGFSVKAGEPRPSREEMEKVQRMTAEHEADLDTINEFMVADMDIEVEINGETVDLKEFIKANGAKIKAEPSRAAMIVGILNSQDEGTDYDASPTVDETED